MYESKNSSILILGFSNSGKAFLMNIILSRKQGDIIIITKSIKQNPQK